MDRTKLVVEVTQLLFRFAPAWTRYDRIDETSPIFWDGIGLDSIDKVDLVSLLEDRFQMRITDEEAAIGAFTSVGALVDFVILARSR